MAARRPGRLSAGRSRPTRWEGSRGRARLAGRSVAVSVLLVVGLGACVQDDGRRFNPLAPSVEPSNERELGYEFDQEIRKHLSFIDDPVILDYVNEVGLRIVESLGSQPFVYHFRVIPDPSLNAFAVPGGYIYLHSGTILALARLDELAGVLAHEVGHVKGRHFARRSEKSSLPGLIAGLAGLAAAAATGKPGFVIAAQAANIAMQLKWSREFEAEADQHAVTFLRRTGFEPAGLVRFLERILDLSRGHQVELPPYLYSHPAPEERMARILRLGDATRPSGGHDERLDRSLPQIQARLAVLIRAGRTTHPYTGPAPDLEGSDPLLSWARHLEDEDNPEGALAILARAADAEPADPRVHFEQARVLESLSQPARAIEAYRRVIAVDPGRALPYYRAGLAYRDLGDKARAVHFLEQAVLRFGEEGGFRKRAEWELTKMIFPVISRGGTADGRRGRGADTIAGTSRERFTPADSEVVWWGQISKRFLQHREELRIRWRDPSGKIVHEATPQPEGRLYLIARLRLHPKAWSRPGLWKVELLLEDSVVDEHSFRLESSS